MKRIVLTTACAVILATGASAEQPVDSLSVVLCEHANFVGPCQTYTVEGWMRHKLVPSLGGFNDRASSIRVGSQVSVSVFEHTNYAGSSVEITADHLNLHDLGQLGNTTTQGDFDDRISSLILCNAAVVPKMAQPPGITAPVPTRVGQPAGTNTTNQPPPGVSDLKYQANALASATLDLNRNRPGHDYRDFDLREADPEICRDACIRDSRCRAFTYVKPGIQGEYARCWLKDAVPPAEHAPCCASGVKR
jgi:hypothetical protein